ncbi:unnamed protein product [Mytilus edulis]|uniref:Macro domain-containing protein n=1 Tax=Mytilus edulis TaxID=6550 RepID=A0A8S3QG41_MYTED|nr:unnamed protein product [Mytilus edulis]
MRFLNPNETKASLQIVFQSKMDFIRSLSSLTIDCPSKISDEMFLEIQRAASNTKVCCVMSENKDTITLCASNYENMSKIKYKAEVTLGIRQQSRGRRNRDPVVEIDFSRGIIVKVYIGNILSLDVDCIINDANENLNHGDGVAYVIAAAAGYDFEKESDDYIQQNGPINEGSCCTTSAGKLKYKSVIHTVGPKWHTYNDKRECCRILKSLLNVVSLKLK